MDTVKQILDLIEPFVEQGRILPRTYEQISENIDDFVFLQKNDQVVACAGLKDCKDSKMGEIYALAVAKEMQNQGLSEKLLKKIMQKAQKMNFSKIFALSKHNAKWFLKHGFEQKTVNDLPIKRQAIFDHQRNSLIFFKNVN